MTHRYRGHRADSFAPADVPELVEIRARFRTFQGAYRRTALGNLGYALTVLKLFDKRFYHVGLLYVLLSALLFIFSFLRSRHSRHDFADTSKEGQPSRGNVICTVGQGGRIYGRPFITAGWVVVGVTIVVATVEIAVLVLVLQI